MKRKRHFGRPVGEFIYSKFSFRVSYLFKGSAVILLRLNFRSVKYNPAVCHHVKCLLCREIPESNHARDVRAHESTTAPSAVHAHRTQDQHFH